MENEVGIIDDIHGILGFTRQLAKSFQRQVRLNNAIKQPGHLSILFEFDPIGTVSLTGTLQVS